MSKPIDLTGQKFGRLTALESCGTNKDKRILWLCQCCCGNVAVVSCGLLRNGHTKSCGCLAKEGNNTKHGHLKGGETSSVYRTWAQMVQRCTNAKSKDYPYYGGRNIKISARWRKSFENFLADMGHPPTNKHTLDRIDNDEGYCKENCRWATMKDQCRNRRSNRLITHQGKTQTLMGWSEETGIAYDTIRTRLNRGWSVGKSLSQPTKETVP